MIDEIIELAGAKGVLYCMPELLRVKAELLLSKSHRPDSDAEACLVQSLEWSRRQGARAWELRPAIDLAALWARRGRPDAASSLLQPLFEQFDEGLDGRT